MNRLGLSLVALGIVIGGCTQPNPANCPAGTTVTQGGCKPNGGGGTGGSSPGTGTTPEASLPPGTGLYSDSGIDVLGGSLTVSAANTPAGAQYRLYGATMAITSTNASGSATLGPLAAGTGYRLIASAPGFATVQIDGIEIVKKQETKRSVQFTPEGTVSGTVTSNGQPVASAVVSDGLNTTLTDVQGKYTLRGCSQGESRVQTFIPQLIELYRSGKLPVDRLVRHYPHAAIDDAVADMVAGKTIKAVLRIG